MYGIDDDIDQMSDEDLDELWDELENLRKGFNDSIRLEVLPRQTLRALQLRADEVINDLVRFGGLSRDDAWSVRLPSEDGWATYRQVLASA